MKCERTSDGRKLDHHALQVMRQQAIKAVGEGQAVASVAAAFGLSVTTIFRWLAKFADGGQNALLAKPIPGRPPKVNTEEMRWIALAVKAKTPQQFTFEFGLWTLSLMRELINRQFGKILVVGVGPPRHETAWFFRAKTAVPGLAARSGAGPKMGN